MKFIRIFVPLAAALSPLAFAADNPQPSLYEEVIVTSSRIKQPLREVATSVSLITREDLNLKGYANLADVLRTEASIGVSNSGGAGKTTALRIRGEEGYRTLVMIDGVDTADPTGTQIGPKIESLMNTYDIERVEILRGAQGFIYGADAGGVVNIITRSGQKGLAGGFSAEGGGEGTVNLGGNIAGGNEIVDFSLSLSDNSTDGFNTSANDTVLQDKDGADNTTIHAKGGWNINENLRASLVYRDIDAESYFDNCFRGDHDCFGSTDQSIAKIALNYSQESIEHSLSYSFTDIERTNLTKGAVSFATEGETTEVEYLGSYALNKNQKVVFGADYEEDKITAIGSESDRDQLGLFAEYQYGWNNTLFLTAGLRHDDNSDFGVHNSYRFSAAYIQEFESGNSLKYRATYGTGFRAPSLSETAYNAGAFGNGVELKEEQSKGYDIGLDYLMDNGALFQITYFDQRIEDEIFFDLVAFSGYLQEAGEIISKGVETSVDYPINQAFSIKANYTFNDTDSATDFTRSRRPEHLANLGLNFLALDDKLSVLANLRVSRDAYNNVFAVGLVELDDYEVVDLGAVYRFDQGLELFGRIQNLTDKDYEEITNFNTQDRTIYAGVRYSF